MRIFQDRDHDLWVERRDGSLICVGEQVHEQCREAGHLGRTLDVVREKFGPVVELIPVTVRITQKVVDEFSNADFTGLGSADWSDAHIEAGLTAALTALGFEVVQ